MFIKKGVSMTLKECYIALSGNFDEALSRLMNERLMEKFLQKFLLDPSFSEIKDAFEIKDGEKAFRGAHTLKGVSANLAFTKLSASSSLLTETLRNTNGAIPEEAYPLYQEVEKDYKKVIDTISSYFA